LFLELIETALNSVDREEETGKASKPSRIAQNMTWESAYLVQDDVTCFWFERFAMIDDGLDPVHQEEQVTSGAQCCP